MTHSNHRMGDREALQQEYVLIGRVSTIAKKQGENKEERYRKLLKILQKYDPVCLQARTVEGGKMEARRHFKGNGPLSIGEVVNTSQPMYVHSILNNKEALRKTLEELKKEDLGISIVVSGIFDEVFGLCKQIGVGPHTANMSLGIHGNTKLLPPKEILELITMCGHGLVSRHLAKDRIEKVKNGTITVEEAAIEMAKQCPCGIFNVERAAELIKNVIKK